MNAERRIFWKQAAIFPNNATVEYMGYLADYTQGYIAVFNVEHAASEKWS